MANLVCNGCNTGQKARIVEFVKPVERQELKAYFLLIIDKCVQCGQKKILPVGLLHSGGLVKFDCMKTSYCEANKINIIREVNKLPSVKEGEEREGFYLLFSEYGVVKRCYSNFSNLDLGKTTLFQGLEKNIGKIYVESAAIV